MKRTRYFVALTVMLAAFGVIAGSSLGDEGRKPEMPALVADAVAKAFPGAQVREVEKEKENGFLLYTVTLLSDGKEMDVEVAPDGTIIGVEKEIAKGDLPAAVAAALAAAAGGGEVKELEQIETRAEIKLVKLEKPVVTFEAAVVVDGKTIEFTIDSTGKIVAKEADDEDDEDDDDGDDDEEDDGDDTEEDGKPVELAQLPDAVKAAIQKAAAGNAIKEIEAITKGDVTIYEADVLVNGKEVEVRVAADGRLLPAEADEEDGGNDD